MTAEPVCDGPWSSIPEWMIPPVDGFTADDFLAMPDLPPHTELIDGSLILVSPQRAFHALVTEVLVVGLRRTVPETLRVRREMSVVLDKRQCPEPDVTVIDARAELGLGQTSYQGGDVLLAVEVVSPESRERDRRRKPQLYAQAGIRDFWLVEQTADYHPIVHVHELDALTGAYVLTGIHHDRLKLSTPFTIDIDLTEVDRI